MRRRMIVALAMALAAIVSQISTARAGSSTQAFVDTGTAEANGTSTNDINGAATLTIGDLSSTATQTGFFVGMSHQDLGQVTFSTTAGTNDTLSFGNSVFGTFTSASLKVLSDVPGAVAYYILGDYTPGSQGGSAGTASFSISFTQSPVGGGAGSGISDSAVFSIPPASGIGPNSVPEPASLVMSLTAFAAFGLVCGIRRRAGRPIG
jgi:hypothetical protein